MLMGWQERQKRIDPRTKRTCMALVYDPVDPLQQDTISQESGFPGPGWGDAASVTQDAGMTPDGTPCQRGVSPIAFHLCATTIFVSSPLGFNWESGNQPYILLRVGINALVTLNQVKPHDILSPGSIL